MIYIVNKNVIRGKVMKMQKQIKFLREDWFSAADVTFKDW